MFKIEPIALTVQSENTYKVRFKMDAGEVEYTFTVEEEPFVSVGCEIPFAEMTNGDPAVPLLTQAIAKFHQARHYRYETAEETAQSKR